MLPVPHSLIKVKTLKICLGASNRVQKQLFLTVYESKRLLYDCPEKSQM